MFCCVLRKIFFKMFVCMARGKEKSELTSDELPELQAREEDESRASMDRMDSQNLSHEIHSRFILTAVC